VVISGCGARLHKERTGYPTQKPEALLERIFWTHRIRDWWADFFVDQARLHRRLRLGRNFIAVTARSGAVHTSGRDRLCALPRDHFRLSGRNPPHTPCRMPRPSRSDRKWRPGRTEADLDYWEVDPDWDGTFSSRSERKSPAAKWQPRVCRRAEIRTGRVHVSTRNERGTLGSAGTYTSSRYPTE